MELSNLLENIERGIYHSFRHVLVETGYIPDIYNFDIENPSLTIAKQAQGDYNAAVKAIREQKGFAIEIYGNSMNLARGTIKCPRIVIETESFLPGELGVDTTQNYERENDVYNVNKYQSLTEEYYFNVRFLANTTKQQRVLNAINIATLPRRGYMKWNPNGAFRPTGNWLVNYISHTEVNWKDEGITERIMRYMIPDLMQAPAQDIGTVSPILQIDDEYKIN